MSRARDLARRVLARARPPRVGLSVVLRSSGEPEPLRETLDRLVAQTDPDLEVVVVLGADEAAYDVDDPRVRTVRTDEAPTWRHGLAEARGSLVSLLEPGDRPRPRAYELLTGLLRSSDADLALGRPPEPRPGPRPDLRVRLAPAGRTTLTESPGLVGHVAAADVTMRAELARAALDERGDVLAVAALARAGAVEVAGRVTRDRPRRTRGAGVRELAAVDRDVHRTLVEHAAGAGLDEWTGRMLDRELPAYVDDARADDESLREAWAALCGQALEGASPGALRDVRFRSRVRTALAAARRWSDLVESEDRFAEGVAIGVDVVGGTPVATLPDELAPLLDGLPQRCLHLAPQETPFTAVVERVDLDAERLALTGWAFLRSVGTTGSPPDLTVRAVAADGSRVALSVTPRSLPQADVWAGDVRASHADAGFEAVLERRLLPTEQDAWHLEVELSQRGASACGPFTHRVPGSALARPPAAADGLAVRWDPERGVALDRGPGCDPGAPAPGLELDGVEVDGARLVLHVHAPGLDADERGSVTVGDQRTRLPLLSSRWDAEHGELAYSLRVGAFGGPEQTAPSAAYAVGAPEAPARAGAAYAGSLPQRLETDEVGVRVVQDQDGVVTIHLAAPMPLEGRSAYGQRRLRERYRASSEPLRDAVLLGSYRGEFATDSQLALDRELAAARPDLTRLWGVADGATVVPEGSVPLLLESPAWYDALATSRFVCTNLELGAYFRRREGQRYLQTFHGYPFKSMGISWWRERGFTDTEIRRNVARVNAQWDTILVPSEECVAYYREEYDFAGPVLVAGYPRCDALVSADAEAVRVGVLGRLGVDPATTVVLYAPTYRDQLTTRLHAAARFDELDLPLLAATLGEGFTVLVRGHNNNQREPDRVSGVARVVDVTDYPDVNGLILAADVAVLDYSSLRFDWALTGKPMVFFVPDLDDYFARRTPLFGFAESAPGPWLGTTEEVAAALADHEGVRRRHADELAAFNRRFNTLNDGAAGRRVVEEFFGRPGEVVA